MDRRKFSLATLAAAVLAAPGRVAALAEGEAAQGVRAALERGALAAVSKLGRTDGFLANPKVRIPLPEPLQRVARLLEAAGQKKRVDELVTAMNRAAEAAVPEGKAVLLAAVKSLSIDDALKIVRGGDTAVTDFFAGRTRVALTDKFLPIVTRATERVKLAERYNALAAKAAGLGLLRGDDVNLQQHVTQRAIGGLFTLIADEERAIRADPLKAGSAILRKVFGA